MDAEFQKWVVVISNALHLFTFKLVAGFVKFSDKLLVIIGINRRLIDAGAIGTPTVDFISFAAIYASLFFKKSPDCFRALIVYAKKVGRISYGEVFMLSGHEIDQDWPLLVANSDIGSLLHFCAFNYFILLQKKFQIIQQMFKMRVFITGAEISAHCVNNSSNLLTNFT